MNSPAQRRLDELTNEVARKTSTAPSPKPSWTASRLEAEELNTQIRTHKAAQHAAAPPPQPNTACRTPTRRLRQRPHIQRLAGLEDQIRPTSLYEMDREQITALKQAARQNTPLRVQIGHKGIEHGSWGDQIRARPPSPQAG